MIAEGFHLEVVDFQHDGATLLEIRRRVFIDEQNVPEEIERDARDAACRHVLARANDGTPIATGRLDPEGKIGRMAVLADRRGQGVGSAVLQGLVDLARGFGHERVYLDAQQGAIDFYLDHGFAPLGDRFVVAGIEHQRMERAIEPLPEVPRAPPPEPPPPGRYATSDRDALYAASLELIGDARRELWLYTRDLDRALFASPQALEALRRVATAGRGAGVHILVQDPEQALRDGHPLVGLAQRLSSSIRFRTPVDDNDRQYPSAFLLNDRGGFVFRTLGSRFDAVGGRHEPGRHRQLLDYFRQVWERSEPPSQLRELHL